MNRDRYITASEAAVILGCTVSAVHRFHEIGRLDLAAKLPGRTGAKLFDRKAVERLARQRVADATKAAS